MNHSGLCLVDVLVIVSDFPRGVIPLTCELNATSQFGYDRAAPLRLPRSDTVGIDQYDRGHEQTREISL